jgi:hypothetical protein
LNIATEDFRDGINNMKNHPVLDVFRSENSIVVGINGRNKTPSDTKFLEALSRELYHDEVAKT